MQLEINLLQENRTFGDLKHNEVFYFGGEKLTKKTYDHYSFAVNKNDCMVFMSKFSKIDKTKEFTTFNALSMYEFFVFNGKVCIKVAGEGYVCLSEDRFNYINVNSQVVKLKTKITGEIADVFNPC